MAGVKGRSGRVRRLRLAENEKQKLLANGYSRWLQGELPDATGQVKKLNDYRVWPFAVEWLNSADYRDRLIDMIEAKEAQAREMRLLRSGKPVSLTDLPKFAPF